MTSTAPAPAVPVRPAPSRRSFWIRQITLWHWVSSGICLASMLLFTITGITLNHAAQIASTPVVQKRQSPAPEAIRTVLAAERREGKHPLPAPLSAWLATSFAVHIPAENAEWSESEVYVSLPRPGGDAWIAIDRATGLARFEKTSRGWISYFNDLHKGRHTGAAWSVFIDVLAGACLIFSLTGLVLLQTHAAKRPATWPLVLAGIALPFALMFFFIHN